MKHDRNSHIFLSYIHLICQIYNKPSGLGLGLGLGLRGMSGVEVGHACSYSIQYIG